MERESGNGDDNSSNTLEPSAFSKAVENREPITLNAWQIDQIIGSLGHCVSSLYDIIEAVSNDDYQKFKRERLASASKAAEEAQALLESLAGDLLK